MGVSPVAGDCAGTAPAIQWGVRIVDAHVFPGAGHPENLRAERASCGPKTVVLRIELPEQRDAMTVAYSGGAAHKQRLLMATSQLKYGDGFARKREEDRPEAGRVRREGGWARAKDDPAGERFGDGDVRVTPGASAARSAGASRWPP
jgi:hypothetical protein